MSRRRRGERLVRIVARLAIRAYPASFRRDHGDDMVDVFADVCLVPDRGPRLTRGLRALFGIVRAGVAERLGLPLQPRTRLIHDQRRSRRDGGIPVTGALQDLKFAVRSLAARPGFTALVVGMLALGVAANAAVFSAFNAAFLRPMPFAEPERLVDLDATAPAWNLETVGLPYPVFHRWRERNDTFESMAAYAGRSFNLSDDLRADRVPGAVVHWSLLGVLGLRPVLGRDFVQPDDTDGAAPVAMISEGLWRERYQADLAVIGSVLRLNSVEHTIVGVLPDEAVIPLQARIWVPLSTLSYCCSPDEGAGTWWLRAVGRLRDGVTPRQALADLSRVHEGLEELLGDTREVATPRVEPLVDRYVGDRRPILLILLGAVGILLLIACANVGGLMLARATHRGQEMGIRMALGAGGGRLVRQLLTESLLLSALGGALGVVAGYRLMAWLFRVMPDQLRGWVTLGLDWRFALFAVLLSTGTALLFGLVPALAAARTAPGAALREGDRGGAGRGRRRALATLVVAEVTLAVVLLVGAALLVRAFEDMIGVEPGFRRDVLTASAVLPDSAYPEREDAVAFFEELERAVAELPGVESAGLSTHRPLGGHTGGFVRVEGGVDLPGDSRPVVLVRYATPAYFDAMGIRFQRGQPYPGDAAPDGGPFEMVVNETFARTFWNDTNVLGNQVHFGGDDVPPFTVVGVTDDTRHYGLDQTMRPGIFLPFQVALDDRAGADLAVRGGGDPGVFLDDVRRIVASLDPDVAVSGVGTMGEHLRESTWAWRMYAGLLGAFAAGALFLALGGIYSTVSYVANQRRREIGIRMALGARDGQVLRQIVGEGMKLALAGLALGMTLAFLVARAVSSFLLEASPRDPVIYLAVGVSLAAATLAANLVPARRAVRANPVHALRTD